MQEIVGHDLIPGFEAPVHRALTEPILLAGAPRTVAIVNGTLSAAIGLGFASGSPAWCSGCRPPGGGLGRQARSLLRRCGPSARPLPLASRHLR